MMTEKEYGEIVKKTSENSPHPKNIIKAFLFGGSVCCFGEVLKFIYSSYTAMNEDEVKAAISVTLIVITAILTGIGVFDKIAKHAGAGTVVPITGFANSIVSPAIEFNAEGRILGTGAKMFNIAGPVIVYGCGAAAFYGFIVYLFSL
ncbi:MAG TPA: SpoVA/SpoVAEb family sporulation membrane protein [Clostridiales bacterium]|jgi:stage V sporulation protein AC|nr:SpoVA/SpoVAEb family sporulation membrane protein [Clostridiales bacterium]